MRESVVQYGIRDRIEGSGSRITTNKGWSVEVISRYRSRNKTAIGNGRSINEGRLGKYVTRASVDFDRTEHPKGLLRFMLSLNGNRKTVTA